MSTKDLFEILSDEDSDKLVLLCLRMVLRQMIRRASAPVSVGIPVEEHEYHMERYAAGMR